jgi:hypothetical protein
MNLLSLEEFRRVLGWSPWHFFGLSDTTYTPVNDACDDRLREYAWQRTDAAGRAEIAEAIESAERMLRGYLGFDVAPRYREDTLPWPRYYDTSRERHANWDATGRFIAPRIPLGAYVQAVGVESLTLVDTVSVAGADLVFTDADGDGLYDTFTATVATAETDPDQIALYHAAANRLDGEAAGERWRIRPVSVSISGGTATIIGRLWLLVRPVLYEGVGAGAPDPTDITAAGPYAQSLEVYQRETNPDGVTREDAQAVVIWETTPCHGWWCCCDSCSDATLDPTNSPRDPAATAYALARAGIRDGAGGRVGIGEALRNATTGIWAAQSWGACREPDRVIVRTYAGYPLEGGQMDRRFQRIVARLGMAELARPLCACEHANRELHRWQFDLARSSGNNDEQFGYISREDLSNPFGTRRGHVRAWKDVRALRLVAGITDS